LPFLHENHCRVRHLLPLSWPALLSSYLVPPVCQSYVPPSFFNLKDRDRLSRRLLMPAPPVGPPVEVFITPLERDLLSLSRSSRLKIAPSGYIFCLLFFPLFLPLARPDGRHPIYLFSLRPGPWVHEFSRIIHVGGRRPVALPSASSIIAKKYSSIPCRVFDALVLKGSPISQHNSPFTRFQTHPANPVSFRSITHETVYTTSPADWPYEAFCSRDAR